jgi:Spy/CpxP family protein refolding chaperone
MYGMAAVFLAMALSQAAYAQRTRWWHDQRFQEGLALSPDQALRLDALFQKAAPTIRAQRRALDALQDELARLIRDGQVDEGELEAFEARVAAARTDLSKTRTLMLFRMHRVLSPEQNLKLDQLFDTIERQRRPPA